MVEHANEMGNSDPALNQHHVGGHRADHGPKHEPEGDLTKKDWRVTSQRTIDADDWHSYKIVGGRRAGNPH